MPLRSPISALFESWIKEDDNHRACPFSSDTAVLEHSRMPEHLCARAALELSDPLARIGVLSALASSANPPDGLMVAGEAISKDLPLALFDAFEAFNLDPKHSRWLALCALSHAHDCAERLFQAGARAEDDQGLSAAAFATQCASRILRINPSFDFEAPKRDRLIGTYCTSARIAELSNLGRHSALEALGVDFLDMSERDMFARVNETPRLPASAHAFCELFASLPEGFPTKAPSALFYISRLRFGTQDALSAFYGIPQRASADHSWRLPLDRLAESFDAGAAEASCNVDGWTLASSCLPASWPSPSPAVLRAQAPAASAARQLCLDRFEEATSTTVESRPGLLLSDPRCNRLACLSLSSAGPGQILFTWLSTRQRCLPGESIAAYLRAQSAMLSDASISSHANPLPALVADLSILCQLTPSESIQFRLNELGHQWEQAEIPSTQNNALNFTRAWSEKFEMEAQALTELERLPIQPSFAVRL